MRSRVTFDRVQHLVRVPVRVNDSAYRFLIDTGIGISVVSSAVAARSDVTWMNETFTGRRMSGQAVPIPLVRLPNLKLGNYEVDGHVAGVADLGDLDGPQGFAGILGPGFFAGHVVTTDPAAKAVTVCEAGHVPQEGYEIPLEVRHNGLSVDCFATLVLPSGRKLCVEVDTGSGSLILDTQFMRDCRVTADDESVSTEKGTDETGHSWIRHWATIAGDVHLAAAPETAQTAPRVQFQDIIHDGLLGADYLYRYRTTFDVPGARLLLAPLTAGSD
ncbi:MAG TPA: retropepsin-like aspartic protease [Streptosporangiaceae bacterium]|nr:retropepsin-like aspartic protease [Streptosporangiaceae bacterium]